MYDVQTLSPYDRQNVVEGLENQRSFTSATAAILQEGQMPDDFPYHIWSEQSTRYQDYWSWFTGERLSADNQRTKDGRRVSKFPLQINMIRNISRKLAALFLGEIPDNPKHIIRTLVKPKPKFSEEEPSEESKNAARFYQNIINEVWQQSNGNAIIQENSVLSQFLGGCYFKYEYVPPQIRPDLRVPIIVKKVIPDFVMPIWASQDEYTLNEAWIVYRISAAAARREYGVEIDGEFGNFVEHWDRNNYSIYINNRPLKARYQTVFGNVVEIDYNKRPNPFGFVPMIYIPRYREGNFYGNSIVPDISALTLEYNGRLADLGSIVRRMADEDWIGRNITGTPKRRKITNGREYVDLGQQNPSLKNPPELWVEKTQEISPSVIGFNETLNQELRHQANMSDVSYGDVDGTQRSGETLKALMWPSVAAIRPMRIHMVVGKSRGDQMILDMLAAKDVTIEGRKIPALLAKDFLIDQDMYPILPKDREAVVNEIVQLSTVDRMSIEDAVAKRGDVDDERAEVKRILEQMEMKAELAKPPESMNGANDQGGNKSNGSSDGDKQ